LPTSAQELAHSNLSCSASIFSRAAPILPRGSVALPVCEFCPLRMATKKRIEVFIGRRQKAGGVDSSEKISLTGRRPPRRRSAADAPCTGTGPRGGRRWWAPARRSIDAG
jgi:hypothetical protein